MSSHSPPLSQSRSQSFFGLAESLIAEILDEAPSEFAGKTTRSTPIVARAASKRTPAHAQLRHDSGRAKQQRLDSSPAADTEQPHAASSFSNANLRANPSTSRSPAPANNEVVEDDDAVCLPATSQLAGPTFHQLVDSQSDAGSNQSDLVILSDTTQAATTQPVLPTGPSRQARLEGHYALAAVSVPVPMHASTENPIYSSSTTATSATTTTQSHTPASMSAPEPPACTCSLILPAPLTKKASSTERRPRQPSPAKPPAPAPLAGLHICLVEKCVGPHRVKIFRQKIQMMGGRLCSRLCPQTTHVVTDLGGDKLLGLEPSIRREDMATVVVVRTDWLSECFRLGRVTDTLPFLVEIRTASQEEEAAAQEQARYQLLEESRKLRDAQNAAHKFSWRSRASKSKLKLAHAKQLMHQDSSDSGSEADDALDAQGASGARPKKGTFGVVHQPAPDHTQPSSFSPLLHIHSSSSSSRVPKATALMSKVDLAFLGAFSKSRQNRGADTASSAPTAASGEEQSGASGEVYSRGTGAEASAVSDRHSGSDPAADSGSDSDSEWGSPSLVQAASRADAEAKERSQRWLQTFACARPASSPRVNHNKHITDILEQLQKDYQASKDQWRALGYQKAITTLKSWPKPVETYKEALGLPNVGQRLADKIWEIVRSGHLRRLDDRDPKLEAIHSMSEIYGIGPSIAAKLYGKGYHSIEDLQKNASVLTPIQQIGLKYYRDFAKKIPRAEVTLIGTKVYCIAKQISPQVIMAICGSYRRGKSECGDVDILLSHPDGSSHSDIYDRLIPRLKQDGLLTDHLSEGREGTQHKYMGVCRVTERDWDVYGEMAIAAGSCGAFTALTTATIMPSLVATAATAPALAPAPVAEGESSLAARNDKDQAPGDGRPVPFVAHHRRIDLISVPLSEWGTALLYFTGSGYFNRSMRLLAQKKGMSLSQHSLNTGVRRYKNEKLNEGEALFTPTEQSVFEALGLQYFPPHERDVQ